MRRLGAHRGALRAVRPAIAVGLVAVLASATGARADAPGSVPGDVPAADQYVESVPSGEGPRDPAASRGRRAPLPAGVDRRLRRLGSGRAAGLRRAATSAELGAPQRKLRSGGKASAPGALPAALGGVDAGGGELVWLVVAVFVITGLGLGAAGYRHRRRETGR